VDKFCDIEFLTVTSYMYMYASLICCRPNKVQGNNKLKRLSKVNVAILFFSKLQIC
jgi:hypothetical protein